jgi:hypothetical protein
MLLGSLSPASARFWKPTGIQLADDYASITHSRNSFETVMIRWWAPPMVMPGTPLAALLGKYILIAIVHFHINPPGGTMSFDSTDTLEARDSTDQPLRLLPRSELPPATIGLLSGLETYFRQSLGRLGEGTKFFVFDADAVHACEKGKLSVPYAGETYTWETPFPGCPAGSP